MKNNLLIIFIFVLGTISAFGQSYVAFEQTPQKRLSAQNEYHNYHIKYKASKKSTIYLELKRGNIIVANGFLDIPRAVEGTANMSIKTKAPNALPPGNNYSYNLYMYNGGRNDWSSKACKSVSVKGISMGQPKKQLKQSKKSMSFRNFFD